MISFCSASTFTVEMFTSRPDQSRPAFKLMQSSPVEKRLRLIQQFQELSMSTPSVLLPACCGFHVSITFFLITMLEQNVGFTVQYPGRLMCRLRMVKPSTHSRSRSTGRRFFSAGSLQKTPLL